MSCYIIKHRRPVIGRLITIIGSLCGLVDEAISVATLGSVDMDYKLRWVFSKTSEKWDVE